MSYSEFVLYLVIVIFGIRLLFGYSDVSVNGYGVWQAAKKLKY